MFGWWLIAATGLLLLAGVAAGTIFLVHPGVRRTLVGLIGAVVVLLIGAASVHTAVSDLGTANIAIQFLLIVGPSLIAFIVGAVLPGSLAMGTPPPESSSLWRSIIKMFGPRRRFRVDDSYTVQNEDAHIVRDSDEPETPAERGRVLNANFAKTSGERIDPRQWLRSDTFYDLLVDIGPRWVDSIVGGSARVPEQLLPASLDGHRIQVVFVSEGLALGLNGTEYIDSKSLWLPNGTGQSHPIVDGVIAEEPSPIAIRFKTPPMRLGTATELPEPPQEIHGRLCLYWENNLLQSAVVKVEVSPPQPRSVFASNSEEPYSDRALNAIQVDYVLTEDFDEFDQLRTRAIKPISSLSTSQGEPITLNITLNDDQGGGHRIIIPSLDEPIFFQYDPAGVQKLLIDARKFLMGCYWRKDKSGNLVLKDGKPILDLDQDNGRSIEAFKRDLYELAKFGSKLFEIIFLHAAPGGVSSLQRIKQLQKALVESTAIQVARTAPATYVFPWDIVYDYPLFDRAEYSLCPIIDEEWGGRGRRNSPVARKCPHHEEHPSNVICPYGFWGLRHRIEQPLSLSTKKDSSEKKVVIPKKPARWVGPTPFYAAFTADAELDQNLIKKHVSALKDIAKLEFRPPPVIDWKGVQASLKSPKVMYFLCHGEYDTERQEPYLGVGLRDQNDQHRVYVSYLSGFFLAEVDADAWAQNRPLIIINGCHTTDLRPGDLLNFVSTFVAAGAGGIIGTEISVIIEVAVSVGEMLLSSFTAGEAIADAIHSMRWQLANRGNLLGLAYTAYCMADLKIEQ